jgi:hypothetical protein
VSTRVGVPAKATVETSQSTKPPYAHYLLTVLLPTLTALAFADPEPVSDEPAGGSAALAASSFPVDEKVEMLWTYTAGPDGLDVGDEPGLEDPISPRRALVGGATSRPTPRIAAGPPARRSGGS